jgi:hypothetical protein
MARSRRSLREHPAAEAAEIKAAGRGPGCDARSNPRSNLFEIGRMEKIYAGVDALSRKYSKHTVFLGSSFQAMKGSQHLTERGGHREA